MPVAVEFLEDENIANAFTKLSAAVTDIIQHTNFSRLQRACIERARTPTMLHKSNEIIPVVKETNSFDSLCSMLADTTYWNFLDIRMMETMATASMIPAAQETIENFKKAFFGMTLKEAAPYFPVIKVKPNHTELYEELDKDPSEMTIGELHKHRFYLETEILKTGADTCTICRIVIGSVMIIWQIHVEHAYQAYSRLKKLHSQPSLQPIHFMSIPEMKHWEGLPLLYGQDIGKIGPIETTTCVRNEPYPLPQGYEWNVQLDSSNFDEVIQLYKDCNPSYFISRKFLQWFISSPLYKKGCFLGIRSLTSKNLVWSVISAPYNVRIGIYNVRIETCEFLCSQIMARFTNHVGLLRFSMCKSDSDGFFQPQLDLCHRHKRLLCMRNMLHRDKDPYCSMAFSAALLHGNRSQAY